MARTCVCVRPVIVPMTISFSADGNYFSLHDKNKQIFYMTRHSISRHSQLHSSAQHYVPPICRRLIIFDRLLTLTLNFLHFWSARFLLHISKLQDNRRRNKKNSLKNGQESFLSLLANHSSFFMTSLMSLLITTVFGTKSSVSFRKDPPSDVKYRDVRI